MDWMYLAENIGGREKRGREGEVKKEKGRKKSGEEGRRGGRREEVRRGNPKFLQLEETIYPRAESRRKNSWREKKCTGTYIPERREGEGRGERERREE